MPTQTFFNLPEAKRDRIVQIGMEELARNTYAQASVTRIVRLAGIAKGSVYQYFEDKKDLYFYLVTGAGQAKLDFISKHAPKLDWNDFYGSYAKLMLTGARFDIDQPLESRIPTGALESPFK
ncbi:MAG: TetR/AcrR family transcriptional regulator [Firmicutes bacterium]|jgi:AcrR family transcriptional regulator|nr:TetR/AcrR family transcriptional regulator [Bacillota bacterium]